MRTRRLPIALVGLALLAGCGEGAADDPSTPTEAGGEADGAEPSASSEPDDDGAQSDTGGADDDVDADDDEDGADDRPAVDGDAAASDEPWDAHIADWPATRVTVVADGEEHELTARIAAEPPDRRQGLMGVEHLPDDAGMLFAFPEDRDGGFWMKDTLVPLDIAFADAEGRIVAIEHMVPCEEDPCPTYEPGTEYRVALEVAGDWFDERGVEVGDRIRWDHLPQAH